SSRRRHTRSKRDWSSDVCSSDLGIIHQLISVDDPLYSVSGVRGFFTLGDVEMYDTNPDYPGLRSIMDDIPDDTVKDLQEMAIQRSEERRVGKEGGTRGGREQ